MFKLEVVKTFLLNLQMFMRTPLGASIFIKVFHLESFNKYKLFQKTAENNDDLNALRVIICLCPFNGIIGRWFWSPHSLPHSIFSIFCIHLWSSISNDKSNQILKSYFLKKQYSFFIFIKSWNSAQLEAFHSHQYFMKK